MSAATQRLRGRVTPQAAMNLLKSNPIFVAIAVQALPFLVLGVTVSASIAPFDAASFLPRLPFFATTFLRSLSAM